MTEKKKMGFAAMDKEKQKEIASKGGKAAHAKGTGHKWTKETAAIAGSKGGKIAHARGTAHKFKSNKNRDDELTIENMTAEELKPAIDFLDSLNLEPRVFGSTEREMDLAFQVEIAEKDQRAEQ